MLTASSAPRRIPHVSLLRAVHDETVVLDLRNRQTIVVNEVGGRILTLLDGCRNLGSIHDQLKDEYSDYPEEIESDLFDFVTELIELNLFELPNT